MACTKMTENEEFILLNKLNQLGVTGAFPMLKLLQNGHSLDFLLNLPYLFVSTNDLHTANDAEAECLNGLRTSQESDNKPVTRVLHGEKMEISIGDFIVLRDGCSRDERFPLLEDVAGKIYAVEELFIRGKNSGEDILRRVQELERAEAENQRNAETLSVVLVKMEAAEALAASVKGEWDGINPEIARLAENREELMEYVRFSTLESGAYPLTHLLSAGNTLAFLVKQSIRFFFTESQQGVENRPIVGACVSSKYDEEEVERELRGELVTLPLAFYFDRRYKTSRDEKQPLLEDERGVYAVEELSVEFENGPEKRRYGRMMMEQIEKREEEKRREAEEQKQDESMPEESSEEDAEKSPVATHEEDDQKGTRKRKYEKRNLGEGDDRRDKLENARLSTYPTGTYPLIRLLTSGNTLDFLLKKERKLRLHFSFMESQQGEVSINCLRISTKTDAEAVPRVLNGEKLMLPLPYYFDRRYQNPRDEIHPLLEDWKQDLYAVEELSVRIENADEDRREGEKLLQRLKVEYEA